MSERASGDMGRLQIQKNTSEQYFRGVQESFIKHNMDVCLPEENSVTFLIKIDLYKFQDTDMIYSGCQNKMFTNAFSHLYSKSFVTSFSRSPVG